MAAGIDLLLTVGLRLQLHGSCSSLLFPAGIDLLETVGLRQLAQPIRNPSRLKLAGIDLLLTVGLRLIQLETLLRRLPLECAGIDLLLTVG